MNIQWARTFLIDGRSTSKQGTPTNIAYRYAYMLATHMTTKVKDLIPLVEKARNQVARDVLTSDDKKKEAVEAYDYILHYLRTGRRIGG